MTDYTTTTDNSSVYVERAGQLSWDSGLTKWDVSGDEALTRWDAQAATSYTVTTDNSVTWSAA